jgi:hypothetical protein
MLGRCLRTAYTEEIAATTVNRSVAPWEAPILAEYESLVVQAGDAPHSNTSSSRGESTDADHANTCGGSGSQVPSDTLSTDHVGNAHGKGDHDAYIDVFPPNAPDDTASDDEEEDNTLITENSTPDNKMIEDPRGDFFLDAEDKRLQQAAKDTTFRNAVLSILTLHPNGLNMSDIHDRLSATYQAMHITPVKYRKLLQVIDQSHYMFYNINPVTREAALGLQKYNFKGVQRCCTYKKEVYFIIR